MDYNNCSVMEPAMFNAVLKMNSTSPAVWSFKNLNLKFKYLLIYLVSEFSRSLISV